jgi:8-oxo-dGTP diphosphatase
VVRVQQRVRLRPAHHPLPLEPSGVGVDRQPPGQLSGELVVRQFALEAPRPTISRANTFGPSIIEAVLGRPSSRFVVVQAILATLGYVLSDDGEQVLLIHRDARPDDPHYGKYNPLGGKLEPGEDVCAGMRREVREEAGIECDVLEFAGTVSWPGFGANGEAWFGFVFRIPLWSGTPATSNPEGTLVWTNVADLLAGKVPVCESDLEFLPLVFGTKQQFHGVSPYENGKPLSWSHTLL